jgi:hypothetical protein
MINGLEHILSRRMWFVPGLVVWGLPGMGEVEFLTVEQIGSEKSILFGSLSIGDSSQEVFFSDLSDHRGNALPETINYPRVLVRSHNEDSVFVVGTESMSSCKLARDPESSGPVTVDLFIIELGD